MAKETMSNTNLVQSARTWFEKMADPRIGLSAAYYEILIRRGIDLAGKDMSALGYWNESAAEIEEQLTRRRRACFVHAGIGFYRKLHEERMDGETAKKRLQQIETCLKLSGAPPRELDSSGKMSDEDVLSEIRGLREAAMERTMRPDAKASRAASEKRAP